MSRRIFGTYNPQHISLELSVPDKLDYWTVKGKRVNFRVSRMDHPEYPDLTGICVIVWIFALRIAWPRGPVC
jgi:hypothetical protein